MGNRLTQQKAMVIAKTMLFDGSLDCGNALFESAACKASDLFWIWIASKPYRGYSTEARCSKRSFGFSVALTIEQRTTEEG
jgi:hypothetical protein